MQCPARDKPASGRPGPRQFRRPVADRGCTCGGPAITSLEGTGDGGQSKSPVTCAVLPGSAGCVSLEHQFDIFDTVSLHPAAVSVLTSAVARCSHSQKRSNHHIRPVLASWSALTTSSDLGASRWREGSQRCARTHLACNTLALSPGCDALASKATAPVHFGGLITPVVAGLRTALNAAGCGRPAVSQPACLAATPSA
jgi:hypothetical protein